MSRRQSIMLVAVIALAGCASHAPYLEPRVDLPAQYRNAQSTEPARAIPIAQKWWHAFNDPVLDRLVEQAISGNLDVEAAAARLQQAAAGTRAARAAMLPSGTFGGSAAVQRQSLDDPLARVASAFPGYERTSDQFGLNAAATWEIDLFGRLSAGRRATAAEEAGAAAAVDGARLTVAAEVATAYVATRELQRRLAIANERTHTLSELDRLVRLRVERGVAARVEGDRAAADLTSTRAAVPVLEAALEETLNRIDVLAGRLPGTARDEIGTGPLPPVPVIQGMEAPAALLRERPDLYSAERRVAAADARVAQAIADYYPRLTIGGLVGFLSDGLSNLLTGGALQVAGSSGFSGRLFDFGSTAAQVEGSRGRTREAIADYRASVLRAVAEVEDSLSALDRRGAQARELENAEAALKRSQVATRRAYETGTLSLQEVLDVERRLLLVQDELTAAQASQARAAVATFRALGGGWRANVSGRTSGFRSAVARNSAEL